MIVIPARLASTRLPRKLLLRETGKPLLQHTFEGAKTATKPVTICVAADDEEIAHAARGFGAEVLMTDPNLASGTDRVAAVARLREDMDIFVNVQGDEPEIRGTAVDLAIELLERHPQCPMSTVASPIREESALHNPACVKVVFDDAGRAIYFSRSPIPHARDWDHALLRAEPPIFYQHMGLYAYRREFLLELSRMPPSTLEKTEKLEQLRVLTSGHTIQVGIVDELTVGIDTPEDYQAFVSRAAGR